MIVSDSLIAAFQALPPMFLQPCVSDPGMGARVPIPSGPRPCRDKLAPNRWPHDHTAIITTYLKTPTTRAVLGTAPKANVVALCATNPQSGAISVDFDDTGFTLHPWRTGKGDPHTVSGHMLYENSDPFILFEPGGHLDVTRRRHMRLMMMLRARDGSNRVPSGTYTVKLEGARMAGFQTI
jgi:hypothetical protein